MWDVWCIIAAVAVVSQILFIIQSYNNYRYAINEVAKVRQSGGMRTLLTIPCKGIDSAFDQNILSFINLDYDCYYLHFVVESADDPAYEQLIRIIRENKSVSKALTIQVLIAGKTQRSSQKIHNLLYSCQHAPEDVEVFAFADSDACVKPFWLSHLVHPLRKEKTGATTGYRWFVPEDSKPATLALSALNAKIAQLLGNTHFNQAWGGSMAIRVDMFHAVGLDTLWKTAISDDLCLSRAIKKSRKKIVFVPACLVASYETTTWKQLIEFVTRQFIITRKTVPGTWWFGLFSSVFSLAGLWAGLILAIIAGMVAHPYWLLFAGVPILFLAGQITRSLLRQNMIALLLPECKDKMRLARRADLTGNIIWSWILLFCILKSAFKNTITWRGITYRIKGPTETEILSR